MPSSSSLALDAWDFDFETNKYKLPVKPFAESVCWRLATGKAIPNDKAPVLSDEALEQLKTASDIQNSTLIEVSFIAGMPLPRIIMRRSCGNGALDRAAIQALRRFLEAKVTDGGKAQVIMLEVDWRNAL